MNNESWVFDMGIFVVSLALLASAMIYLHALDSGLSGSDEGSHFLNGYMIWSYLTEAIGQNPLTYAKEFYVHYPKISIGHWPPLYYAFLACFFFVLPHTPFPFMVVNLVIGALPTLLVGRVVRRILGWRWAILAAVTYVLTPICLNNTMRLMLDQALAGLCLLAALLWSRYSSEPNLRRGLGYAVVAAAAILVKGNGWVLGVFPFFHIALTGRWRILRDWRTYAAGALGLLIVGIWTVATYKISSDGFNYEWGVDYFVLALSTFLTALYENLGPFGSIAVSIGIVGIFSSHENAAIKEVGRTCLAMVLTTILFHSIVPVDLDSRYMSSAIPPLAILVTFGVWMLLRRFGTVARQSWAMLSVAVVLLCVPGLLLLRDRQPRFDMRMDVVAEELSKSGGMVIVIDGNSSAEGALTAEVALRDSERQNYVVRSSQLLAKSNFMGKRYALRVDTPEAVLGLLDDISSNAVVVAAGPFIEPRFAHSDLLLSALRLPASPFRIEKTYEHDRHDGRTYLFLRETPASLNREAVKRVNFPEKAPR